MRAGRGWGACSKPAGMQNYQLVYFFVCLFAEGLCRMTTPAGFPRRSAADMARRRVLRTAAGRIDFAIYNIGNQSPGLKAQRVRALAVTSSEHWPSLPDVPTMAEAGVPGFVVTSWGALVMQIGRAHV